MNYYEIHENLSFIGREHELARLQAIHNEEDASMLVVYGRRRVGKTELIEQFFKTQNVLKFEGLQPDQKKKKTATEEKHYQIRECVRRLGVYAGQESIFKNLQLHSWAQFFEILSRYLEEKTVLYFDEIQWLAHYQDEFFAELKPFWDDTWRHIKQFRLVLTGSSPSFLISQLLGNKALYARLQHEIHLQPFRFYETIQFLCKQSAREQMLAMLCVGGVPEYLRQLAHEPSILIGLCQKSFLPNGFLTNEYERIFVSSLSNRKHYRKVIALLAKNRNMTRTEIARALKMTKMGGSFSAILEDLEKCQFISKYSPLTNAPDSKIVRYCIADEYLNFYHRFIQPRLQQIQNGDFQRDPTHALPRQELTVTLGFAFERWCRKNHRLLAKLMRFDQIEYRSGAYFTRDCTTNFQIDLMYIRNDHVIVVCEIKYLSAAVPASSAVNLLEKIEFFRAHEKRYKNYTYKTALITTEGLTGSTEEQQLFDAVITLADLVGST